MSEGCLSPPQLFLPCYRARGGARTGWAVGPSPSLSHKRTRPERLALPLEARRAGSRHPAKRGAAGHAGRGARRAAGPTQLCPPPAALTSWEDPGGGRRGLHFPGDCGAGGTPASVSRLCEGAAGSCSGGGGQKEDGVQDTGRAAAGEEYRGPLLPLRVQRGEHEVRGLRGQRRPRPRPRHALAFGPAPGGEALSGLPCL